MQESMPATAGDRQTVSLDAAITHVLTELNTREVLSEQSHRKFDDTLRRFERFARVGHGVEALVEAGSEVCRAFVEARHRHGPPAVATMHLRRTAVRLLFRTGRELGLVGGDPTLDLELPPKTPAALRPLSDDEVALCRSASLHTLSSTRPSAAWSLAEATATTAELPRITVGDLRLGLGRVWIAGSAKTEPRWGHLDAWGCAQLSRRVRALCDDDPARPVIYEGDGSAESRQASACLAISDTLVRAGLAGEPDVRPASVAAWAGARMLTSGTPIEELARRLGRRSLDATARFIGFDWRRVG